MSALSRRPTVSPRGGLPPDRGGARAAPLVRWLKRESLSVLAMTGAALTLLAELRRVMPVAPKLASLLDHLQAMTQELWRPPLELAGIGLHHDLVAALNIALFLTLIGLGARVSAAVGGPPIGPLAMGRFFDDQTTPSLVIFAAICMVFLIGHGAGPGDPLIVFGDPILGRYAFAILVTLGYFAGDFLGHAEFHRRLYRLAVLVAVLVGVNFLVIASAALT